MQLKIINQELTVCKISDLKKVDFSDELFFIAKTDEELSLVCSSDRVPSNASSRSDGWNAFRIEGELDFSLVGILSTITSLLFERGISVFAVSTYNTDYILTKKEDFTKAVEALKGKGYNFN